METSPLHRKKKIKKIKRENKKKIRTVPSASPTDSVDQGAASQDDDPQIETTATQQETFFRDAPGKKGREKKERKRHERYNVNPDNIVDRGRRDPVPKDEKIGDIPPLKSGVPWTSAETRKKQDATILGDEDGNVQRGAKRKWRTRFVQIESPSQDEDSSPELCFVRKRDVQSGLYGKNCLECLEEDTVEISVIDPRGHTARWLRVECTSCSYVHENTPPKIGRNHVYDLKVAYMILKGDISTQTYGAFVNTLGLRRVSVDTLFSNHQSHVLALYRKFYEKMLNIAHEAVIKFISENNLGECINGRYEVTISIDGCYPKRSYYNNYSSLYGVTFIICVYTGIILGYYVAQKCNANDCEERNVLNTQCKYGLFHGHSSGLEVAGAKALFTKNRNDADCRLLFATYVGDGDSAVGREILKDPNTKKLECQFHYRKSSRKKLIFTFHNSVVMIPKKRTWDRKTQKWSKQTYYPRYPLRAREKSLALSYSNQILTEVRRNLRKPATIKRKAILAICLHNFDHRNATRAQRRDFHQYCNKDWCAYKDAVSRKEKYVCRVNRPLAVQAEVREKVLKCFEKCANLAKLGRLNRNVSTNMNESIHARFFEIVTKVHHYSYARICYAAEQTILEHNFGHYGGSFLHVLGKRNQEKMDLQAEDKRTDRKAATEKRFNVLYMGQRTVPEEEILYEPGRIFEDLTDDVAALSPPREFDIAESSP